MRRLSSFLLTAIITLGSFASAFYLFLPKDTALAYIWSKGALALAQKGVGLESASRLVEESPLRVVVRRARLSSPIASAEAASVIVTPLILRSLFGASLNAKIQLESFSLILPLPGQAPLALSSFATTAKLRSSLLILEGVQATGDLNITGDITINLLTQKIEEGEISISGQRADLLELAKGMLPIEKEASGEWKLKRKKGEKK